MAVRTKIDTESIRARLIAMREDLARLAQAHEADRAPVELDQTMVGRLSRMDALQGQAMAQEVARRRETEIKRIEAALKRMDDGDYGYCVSCGEKIAVRRLELDPAAATCINCARSGTA